MIVEIPISAGTLAGALAKMRTWLDHNRSAPVLSQTKKRADADIVLVRAEFNDAAEAEAFRLAFDADRPELSDAAA